MGPRVVEVPELRPLVLRVPLAECVAEREYPLLRARLFLVAARAADARVELEFGDGVEKGHRLMGVAALQRILEHDPAGRDRILDRANDQPLAEFGGALVPKCDDLGEIVPGVHVQQRERKAPGTKRFLGEPQQDQRVLAARKKQRGIAALAGNFAQDVDGFRFEPSEVVGIDRRHGPGRAWLGRAVLQYGGRHVVTGSVGALLPEGATSAGRACSPHSLCSATSHHQRPERGSSPGTTARVHGEQPMLG